MEKVSKISEGQTLRKRRTVKVRGLELGAGLPKICAPLGGQTEVELLKQLPTILAAKPDLLEWRADGFAAVRKPEAVVHALKALRASLPQNLPLLFTIRTKAEGGAFAGSAEEYLRLNEAVLESGCADFIDLELFTVKEEPQLKALLAKAKRAGTLTVLSSHDFEKTPPEEELFNRLLRMQALGADIPKLAVMPQSSRDVLTLLSASERFAAAFATGPFITMSMGQLGLLSRLCGECFGSAVTFGAAGYVSAPGQPKVEELREVLRLLHGAPKLPDGKKLYLIGFMGVGKSCIARALAQKLSVSCREMDEEIEQAAGMAIKDIFAQFGEKRFRDLESGYLLALSRQKDSAVVSCGGGAVLRQENQAAMRENGWVLWLTAEPETILSRVRGSKDTRPILKDRMNTDAIAALLAERAPRYAEAADCQIATDGRTPEEICADIFAALEQLKNDKTD